MLGRPRGCRLQISCGECCRLERVENRCGNQLRHLTGAQQLITGRFSPHRRLVATRRVRAVAAGSGSGVVGKGGRDGHW